MSLPQHVLDLVRFKPLEDLVLALLREKFQVGDEPIPVQTLIRPDQTFPLVLIRKGDDWGRPETDQRFLASGTLVVHTFAEGLDADEDAALLGEAVREVLTTSINKVKPGLGHLTMVDPISLPSRSPDWATATGPVQYADLPDGVERYEAKYELAWRRPVK